MRSAEVKLVACEDSSLMTPGLKDAETCKEKGYRIENVFSSSGEDQ